MAAAVPAMSVSRVSRSLRCARYATLAEPTDTSATARAERSLRRFWKTATVEALADGYTVKLDRRSLRTPAGTPLLLPKRKLPLAALIAHEWDSQDRVLKPHSLPLTSLAARAIDGLGSVEQRTAVIADLSRYMDTDTICYHADDPPELVVLQRRHWLPLLAWVKERFGAEIRPYTTLLGGAQSPQAKGALFNHLSSFDSYKLAAFERATLASKSYIIALALVDGFLTAEDAAQSAHVEVQSQINRWGEVEDTHDVDHQDIRSRLASAKTAVIDA